MNNDNVDRFLLAHKVEIEDNGFSDRVLQSLPAHVDWQRRLGIIWNCIFIAMLAVFCWQTDVLSNLKIDIEVFINNLPLHLGESTLWYSLGTIAVGMYALVFAWGKKLNNL